MAAVPAISELTAAKVDYHAGTAFTSGRQGIDIPAKGFAFETKPVL
jgi:hypothetical protein